MNRNSYGGGNMNNNMMNSNMNRNSYGGMNNNNNNNNNMNNMQRNNNNNQQRMNFNNNNNNNGNFNNNNNQQTHNQPFPHPPVSFPDLDSKSIIELKTLQHSDQAFKTYFQNLPYVRGVENALAQLKQRNIDAAKKNMSQSPDLTVLQTELAQLRPLLAQKKNDFMVLQEKQRKVANRYSAIQINKMLQDACDEMENKSAKIAEDFLSEEPDSKINISAFVKDYMKCKTLYFNRKKRMDALHRK